MSPAMLLQRSAISFSAVFFLVTVSHAAVLISSDATENMSCQAGVCSPTASNAVLNVMDLENLIASGNVEVTTTGSGIQADDIQIVTALTWTSANSLTLDAYQSIEVDQAVSVGGLASVSLLTNDGGSGGTLSFHPGGNLSFAQTTNALSINGKSYKLASTLPSLISAVAKNPEGRYALATSYDASKDGTYSNDPIHKKFKGTFSGLGNSISNLTIDSTNPNVALFAYVGTKGAINSLVVSNAQISARETRRDPGTSAGTIAAINYGTIFNSFSSGIVSAKGRRDGVIAVGGLVAQNVGEILDSGSDASIVASQSHQRPTIGQTGGLAGGNIGRVENSYATGSSSVTISETSSGGLLGLNSGQVENCYAEGNVTVTSAASSNVGGLVGISSSIGSSYSTGSPSASSGSYVGGVLGYDDSQGQSSDYWDMTTSGITDPSQGAGNIANDPGITGETTQQLQAGLPAGFDPSTWAENANINNGLPYLIANPPQ